MSSDASFFDNFQRQFKGDIFPANWQNPTPAKLYDLVIIGGGPGGMTAATAASNLNAKVALVEQEHLGGECLSYGCIPSKAFLRASRVAHEIRHAAEFGMIVPPESQVDYSAVIKRVRGLQMTISPHDSAEHFKNLGVDVFLGKGTFNGESSLQVGGQTLNFKKAIITTGTRPVPLDVPGWNPQDNLTNQTIFNSFDLPQRLTVVGAGPICCELAQAFARFGSQVTLITRGPYLLSKDEAIASERLNEVFISEGIKIHYHSKVVKGERKGNEKILYIDTLSEPIVGDEVLVAIGRLPYFEGLNLEKAGVEYTPVKGIKTDEYLQTTNPHIYSAGDVSSPFKFTHISQDLNKIAVANALHGNKLKKSSLIVPWCTYTDPEVAHVGLHEIDAQKMGIKTQVSFIELASIDRAILDGETKGFLKMVVKENTGQILGATIMASHAGDMISEISVAMQSEKGLEALAHAVHPFPTQAQVVRAAAMQIMQQRKKLQTTGV